MNSQELETAMRLGVPFVTLIFHDGGYGLIGWKQQTTFGREAFVKFGNPDFVRYAESFGAKGYRVETAGELPGILQEAFRQPVPVIIDCPVDTSENLRLTERLRQAQRLAPVPRSSRPSTPVPVVSPAASHISRQVPVGDGGLTIG